MSLRHVLCLLPLLVSALGAGTRPPGLGDVTDVRFHNHPTHTRIVIDLSQPAVYSVHKLANPERLYVDIEETWVEAPLREPLDASAPRAAVRRLRGGQNTLRRARFVFELSGHGQRYHVFHLENPSRIVTDIYPDSHEAPEVAAGRAGTSFHFRPMRRVVIDAGHGGKDPGAIGSRRTREKDVVLQIARELRERLVRAGLDVVMTREADRYVSLVGRTDMANRRDADLFVSIHANSSPTSGTRGVETYLLDTRYDRQSARVAARENGTTIAKLDELQKILASLRLTDNERYAAILADSVHDSLVHRLRADYPGTRDLGIKRGPFLVLFHADMPSILVEVGFVTNGSEAKRMKTRGFARAAAEGIALGVIRYRDLHARNLVAGR